jgi:uncharacterized protein YndB with AHSA1/START domain
VSVIPPLVKEVVVGCPPGEAFAVFTAGVRRWWPLASHSVGGSDSELVLDEHGFVETLADGTASAWGTVLAWEPSRRVSMTWHPGQDPDPHTLVDVTFEPAPGGTLVRLVHSGWENLGRPVSESMGNYDEGWGVVLGAFVDVVAPVGGAR